MGGAAGPTTTAATRGGTPDPSDPGAPPPPSRRFRLPRLRPASARPRGPRRRLLVYVPLALAVLAGLAGWVLYGSSWLRAERVTVTGTRELTEDQVRSAADVPVGDPLASVDTGAVAGRITGALTRVARVDVVRDWPRGVRLEVTERTPELVMAKPGEEGTYLEVDARGVRYAAVRERPAGVPLLVLDLDASPSNRRFGADRLRAEAVRAVGDLPAAVRKETRVLRMRSYDSLTLELSGDRTVLWGSSEAGEAKAAVLVALMKAEENASHFDVSVPAAPAASGD
ncbi:FtsQ-type POTRA domain-containing protein [Streptomyces sp. TRM 70351]|uniref:cell division protein FtsQ/DivIB n=1 Tax=Streptomyces sp. TRM 70351 TaxID=3116552 RepID=UPI002E7B1E33|nr:FtsQ-type POTRA domain-containing protein [Streptomyces sp. TRM 70351]MEE1928762.1 FtsQ-type POTRA domain-containing protein [Streptomyces sp. TRM 70351]